MSEKLQKVLARCGLGSRREMEAAIDAGRASINGETAKLGDRVEAEDIIRFDGNKVNTQLAAEEPCRVLIYHKSDGEICSRSDPEGRPTVFARLPRLRVGRWIAVGRLDINTQGLLLFTNDGELANRLMHPRFEVEREYAVRVFGQVSEDIVQRLRTGVQLEDGVAKFTSVKRQGGEGLNQWLKVTLNEGRNREVRRMWESQEVQVSRLIRTRYGQVILPKQLPRSAWKEVDLQTVNYLRSLVQLPAEEKTLLKVGDKDRTRTARIRRSVRKHQIRLRQK
ncbi:23S rRNA pseudouridine(2605) synthase RluB [Celerinatantimonas sp. MCCC 1A17872]|uniref:23S rRNA pseudouridine(2605) synthase RluB n=1 Tax=Celerinatantimonas sp. MCCC 1A17872 TaxID=3177514 RepID=UPI0038C5B2E7